MTVSAAAPAVTGEAIDGFSAMGVDRVVAMTLQSDIAAARDELSALAERAGVGP